MTKLDYIIENILDILIELNNRQDFLERTMLEMVNGLSDTTGVLSDDTFLRAKTLFDKRMEAINTAKKPNIEMEHSDNMLQPQPPEPKPEPKKPNFGGWAPDGDIK